MARGSENTDRLHAPFYCAFAAVSWRRSRPLAADVALIGVIGDKAAVFAIDGGEPKTVKVGQKLERHHA